MFLCPRAFLPVVVFVSCHAVVKIVGAPYALVKAVVISQGLSRSLVHPIQSSRSSSQGVCYNNCVCLEDRNESHTSIDGVESEQVSCILSTDILTVVTIIFLSNITASKYSANHGSSIISNVDLQVYFQNVEGIESEVVFLLPFSLCNTILYPSPRLG